MNFLQKVATDIIKNMNDEIVVDTNNIDENRNNSSVQVLVLIIFSLLYITRKHIYINYQTIVDKSKWTCTYG